MDDSSLENFLKKHKETSDVLRIFAKLRLGMYRTIFEVN